MEHIEDLRQRREELTVGIARDEEEKARLLSELKTKKDRLMATQSLIQKRIEMRSELEEDISLVEDELLKITESSANLLKTLKSKLRTFE